MVSDSGEPKRLRMVLEERGVNVRGMKKEDMQKKLQEFENFKNEKMKVERLLWPQSYISPEISP